MSEFTLFKWSTAVLVIYDVRKTQLVPRINLFDNLRKPRKLDKRLIVRERLLKKSINILEEYAN